MANKLGKRVSELRKLRDLSARELAKLAGVSALTVRGLELGYRAQSNPSIGTLRKIAVALRVDVAEVVR
jgi:transcriptional regulator with XRE-family HTH domain